MIPPNHQFHNSNQTRQNIGAISVNRPPLWLQVFAPIASPSPAIFPQNISRTWTSTSVRLEFDFHLTKANTIKFDFTRIFFPTQIFTHTREVTFDPVRVPVIGWCRLFEWRHREKKDSIGPTPAKSVCERPSESFLGSPFFLAAERLSVFRTDVLST